MLNEFKEFVKSCESQRIEEVYDYIGDLEEMKELTNRVMDFSKELASLVPEGEKFRVMRYDDAQNDLCTRTSELCYWIYVNIVDTKNRIFYPHCLNLSSNS